MKIFPQIIGLILMMLYPLTIWSAEQDRLFYDAVRAEASGDFDSAIKLYKAATKFGHSANLYGNLANLYFKNEDYGKSILHFNRALILNPSDSTLLANLNFALESKNIPKTERKFVKNYLSSELLSLWIIVSLSIFWSGLLLVAYLVNFRTNKKSLIFIIPAWLLVLFLSSYATILCYSQYAKLERKVIVYKPNVISGDLNSTKIPLRRFAGESNSANTTVVPGEALFVDEADDGKPKSHTVSDGEIWFLVRDIENNKKGWIKEDEFGWVLPNNGRSF